MKEIHYWIANDGKKFDDEDECREYEYKCRLKELNGSLITLDINGNPNDGLKNLGSFVEAMFVRMDNKEAVDFWYDLNNYFGYTCEGCERKPGLYYYNDRDGAWHSFDDEIKELERQKAMLMEVRA